MRAPSEVGRRCQAHRPSVVAHLFGFDHLLRLHIDVQFMPFPHVVFTDVSGINNRGQIVGRYLTTNPADVNNIFNHGFIATPVPGRPSSTAQLAASPAPTVARADGVATPALRLSLDACPGVEPQDGSVTPAKLSGRWISCSQAVVPE